MPENSHSRATVSDLIILDTSVFIDHLRAARHEQRIRSLTGLLRISSVVLAELWRGATTNSERKFLRTLEKNHPMLTPTQTNWIDSGEILSKIQSRERFLPAKLRDLHFDVLIALTARSCGARLITSNRSDFELINRYRQFRLEIW
jgi:predicted nucleic acid-binding protein